MNWKSESILFPQHDLFLTETGYSGRKLLWALLYSSGFDWSMRSRPSETNTVKGSKIMGGQEFWLLNDMTQWITCNTARDMNSVIKVHFDFRLTLKAQ